MNIRVATKHDVSTLSQLVQSLSHFYLTNGRSELPVWFTETLTPESFLNRIHSEIYHNFVYEIQGEIIGYLSFKGNSHLYHLFVCESHQGKGISKELWNYAIKLCVSKTYTLRSSLYAVAVYKKLGFSVSGEAGEKDGIGFQPMELIL